MSGLYPIIRRIRRPLLSPGEPIVHREDAETQRELKVKQDVVTKSEATEIQQLTSNAESKEQETVKDVAQVQPELVQKTDESSPKKSVKKNRRTENEKEVTDAQQHVPTADY